MRARRPAGPVSRPDAGLRVSAAGVTSCLSCSNNTAAFCTDIPSHRILPLITASLRNLAAVDIEQKQISLSCS